MITPLALVVGFAVVFGMLFLLSRSTAWHEETDAQWWNRQW